MRYYGVTNDDSSVVPTAPPLPSPSFPFSSSFSTGVGANESEPTLGVSGGSTSSKIVPVGLAESESEGNPFPIEIGIGFRCSLGARIRRVETGVVVPLVTGELVNYRTKIISDIHRETETKTDPIAMKTSLDTLSECGLSPHLLIPRPKSIRLLSRISSFRNGRDQSTRRSIERIELRS